ncbi:integrase arm-type DNA-binding domain-containing protein [Alteriqipengyuania sp. NZ-12B]|uniref:Integrase arm-type DNA-binding domain-containing protein n=1 Tax=Alteriqipengyuania abyssalis TaxID=2860200 RepID=A0ABS7P9Y6_9SPHN|nr:site-specific integrase [Alteriqipengyuania abyssalis]MBY8335882.1 integrase arm-type DNA-binding domain-containing protein [Alteriqipengyuania abyssalis]
MAIHKLKAFQVEKAKKAGRYGDGGGLYLLVSPTGGKSWVLRIMCPDDAKPGAKKRRDIGLGGWPDCSLSEAREKARELRRAVKAGRDPLAERDQDKIVVPTFKAAAIQCHEAKAPGWSEKTGAAFLSSLALHVYPKIGSLRVDAISERDIAAALSPVWHSKPAISRKLRHRIGLVLDYAKASGWRSEGAPRQSLSALLSRQAEGGNFASMPYEELPAFVAKMESQGETVGRLALLFTIYTAARNGEVREALWSHIDLEAGEWRRPAELMRKNGEAHTITLSPEAMAVLERAKAWRTGEGDCRVFPGKGGKKLSDMTLAKYLAGEPYVVHGFRATFRTWAAERMPSIPDAVAEAALAHKIPDKVVRAYQRAAFLDMRRTLLDAWGRYVSGSSGDVVQLPLKLRNALPG